MGVHPKGIQVLPIHVFGFIALVAFAASVVGPRGAHGACRETPPLGAEAGVRWLGGESDSAALAAWCAAVGTPVLAAPREAVAADDPVSRLVVVSWNVKGGAGALERLIDELRRGELTDGEPAGHFALLLQEAVRVGGSVPAAPGPDAVSARAIGAGTDPARSVEAVAARTGLFVFYAPSMRNGAQLREDRGNAILSTLPLTDPVVIELPYERQRRAAVTARIALPVADGESVPLRLVSAHFDNTSSGARFWRSFGKGRARQARGLIEVLPEDEWVVLGGDLNTWFGEAGEEAVALLSVRLAQPRIILDVDTYSPPYGLPHRQTDYLLASLPEGWQTGYQVTGDWRNSDHAPLVGWLEPPPRAVASGPAAKEER